MEFEDKIVQRTLLHRKNNSDGQLIFINVLEFITVIINYCGALTAFMTGKKNRQPQPRPTQYHRQHLGIELDSA